MPFLRICVHLNGGRSNQGATVRCFFTRTQYNLCEKHFRPPMIRSVHTSSLLSTAVGDQCDGPSDPSLSMDAFLNKIQYRGKIFADATIIREAKFKKLEEQKARRIPPRQESISKNLYDTEFRLPNFDQSTNQSSADSPKPRLNPEDVFAELKRHDNAGTCPSSQFLITVASVFGNTGGIEGVRLCQKLLAQHNPSAFHSEMKLNLQLADALANSTRLSDAVVLLKALFYDYPLKRRKISSIFRFMALRTISNYPCPDEMVLIKDFAQYCLGLRDTMPLLHIWQALFLHSSPGAHSEANDLLNHHESLLTLACSKLDTLLRRARDGQDSRMLFRMLPLLDVLKLPEKDVRHFTGCILNALMEIYCANHDVEGGKALMQMIQDEQQRTGKRAMMWPETVRKYAEMAGVSQVVPLTPRTGGSSLPQSPKFLF